MWRCGSAIIRWQSSGRRVASRSERHDRRAERDVRHEMAVHDVQVDDVALPPLDLGERLGEAREVGGEDRWRDADFHGNSNPTCSCRLTTTEIASFAETGAPARGYWRMIRPSGSPG